MSLAKRFVRPFTGSAHKTLLVSIGMQRIEYGVMARSGSAIQWETSASVEIPHNKMGQPSLQALIKALQAVPTLSALSALDAMHVMVTDSWLATINVPWSSALMRADTAQAYGRTQLIGAGFEVESGDIVKLDDAPFGRPRLIVAYSSALVLALDQWADRQGTHLASLLPLSVSSWLLVRQIEDMPSKALAVFDSKEIIIMRGEEGTPSSSLSNVNLRRIADNTSVAQALGDIWRRLCLRDPQWSGVQKVALLDLAKNEGSPLTFGEPFTQVNLPTGRKTSSVSPVLRVLESMGSSSCHALNARLYRPSWGGWRWAILGALILLAAVLVVQAAHNATAARAMAAELTTKMSAQQPAATATIWGREDVVRVQAVNAAIRELNLSVAALLRALEPPQDIHVAVLSVEIADNALSSNNVHHQAAFGVKITAEARTGADMTHYVAFVSGREPFTKVYLVRHEINENTRERTYRFTMEAEWIE